LGNEITRYDAVFAEAQAKQLAETRQTGGAKVISTRGGVLSFEDEELPGNQMCVIVLDSVHENTYYAEKFDQDKPAAPTCYAYGRLKGEDMAPHESMQAFPNYFVPQHDECSGCPMNEWGSADTGRGKACQNRERLAIIPAGYFQKRKNSRDFDLELFDDPKHFESADIVFLKLPPTSLEYWAKFLSQIGAAHRRPSWGVVARVWLEPHAKHQYHVRFEMLELLPDALVPTVMARVEEAAAGIITPYTPPEEREEEAAPAARGGLRGLRR
jgi:hypothetical protein